ncbi:MAG TPA: hypothetical protein VG942_15140 [Hyphomonadaceae bacterium]|nr:hypothetical protein [Hyphomonadaceae bacterium]
MRRAFALISLAIVAGAADAAPPVTPMSPAEAVAAAAVLPDGAIGVFQFVVKSLGDDEEDNAPGEAEDPVYLNSDGNHRVATNLSVMIMPAAARDLANILGGPLGARLLGKRVSITGTARQQKIDLLDARNRPTGKAYLQTRIIVNDADQIKVR